MNLKKTQVTFFRSQSQNFQKHNFNNKLKRIKTNVFNISKKEEDFEIIKFSKEIKNKIDNGKNFFEIPFFNNNFIKNLLLFSLTKRKRKEEHIYFIGHYLSTFSSLREILNISQKNVVDINELILNIGRNLKYEEISNKNLIFRFGDIRDKFYMILSGKVSVLIVKNINIKMSEYEYISHLKYLYSIKEIGLIKYIIELNESIFDKDDIYNIIFNNIEFNPEKGESKMFRKKLKPEELDYCSVEEYIERSKPLINPFLKNLNIRKNLQIAIYEEIIKLGEGETFGEMALLDTNIRNASILCINNCIFGSLSKNMYDNCIKNVQLKLRRKKISFVLNCELFKEVQIEDFERKYFNFFKNFKLNQNDYLFKQGNERNEIYFIKQGEIELYMKTSLNELKNLIKKSENIKFDENKEKKELKKIILDNNYNFLNQLNTFHLFKIKENEIIGLNDYLDENNNFICDAKCISNNTEIYSIHIKYFNDILKTDYKIRTNFKDFINKKNKIMIERLFYIRNTLLNQKLNQISYENKKISMKLDKIFEKEYYEKQKNSFLQNSISFKHFKLNKKNKKIRIKNTSTFMSKKLNNFDDNKNLKNIEIKIDNNIINNNNNNNNKEKILNKFISHTKTNSTENALNLIKKRIQKKYNFSNFDNYSSKENNLLLSNSNFSNSIENNKYNLTFKNYFNNKNISKKRILIPIFKTTFNNSKKRNIYEKIEERKYNFISNETNNNFFEKKIFNDILDISSRNKNKIREKFFYKSLYTNQTEFNKINPLIVDNIIENFQNKKNKKEFLFNSIKPYKNKIKNIFINNNCFKTKY